MKYIYLSLVCFFSLCGASQITWYPLTTTMPSSIAMVDMAMAPNGDVFMICGGGSTSKAMLYKSTDNGNSWAEVLKTGLPNYYPLSMAFSGNRLVLALDNNPSFHVYASSDLGATWSSSSNGIPSDQIPLADIAQAGTDLYLTGYGSTANYLFKSTDNGANWSQVTTTGLPTGFLPIGLGSLGTSVLIGSGTYEVFLSANGGQNWASSGSAAFGMFIAAKFATSANGNTYAIGRLGNNPVKVKLFKSTNGSTWTEETMTGNEDMTRGNSILQTKGPMLACGEKNMNSNALYTTAAPAGIVARAVQQPVLYPNPCANHITLQAGPVSFENVQIFSVTGQLVHTVPGPVKTIKVGHLPAGLYVLQAVTAQGPYTARFVKE